MATTTDRPPLPAGPRTTGSIPVAVERRAEPRHASGHVAFVRNENEPEAAFQNATIWDVSALGVGLLLGEPVERGTVLHLSCRHLAVRDLKATVVHSSPKEHGWLVGCELDRRLSLEELHALQT